MCVFCNLLKCLTDAQRFAMMVLWDCASCALRACLLELFYGAEGAENRHIYC